MFLAIPKCIGIGLSLILRDANRGHGCENWKQSSFHCGGSHGSYLSCFDASAKMTRGNNCRRHLSLIVIGAITVSLVMSMAACLCQCGQGGKWKKESLE